jgi:hypothetical protein
MVESLRSGVPFPALAQKLPVGRSLLLERLDQRLRSGSPDAVIIRANYGDGKTHFLQSAAGLALERNYVVSQVSISREAPLYDPALLFAALAAGTRTPRSRRLGLAPVLDALRDRRGEVLGAIHELGVPERLRATLEAYLQVDLQFRDELLADLSGQHLMVSRLRAILKELGLPHRVENFVISRGPVWSYRLFAALIRLAGFRGWVILLDEVELIGKTSLGQRAGAYATLFNLSKGWNLPQTWVVAAIASNYYTDVLEEKHDGVKALEWLTTRGRLDDAQAARQGIEMLMRAERLPALSASDFDALLGALRQLHATAYGWDPPPIDQLSDFVRNHVQSADARVRTRIRTAIQWLDLWYQYGREPSIVVWRVEEMDLSELPGGDDEEADPPVRRTRIF